MPISLVKTYSYGDFLIIFKKRSEFFYPLGTNSHLFGLLKIKLENAAIKSETLEKTALIKLPGRIEIF